MSPERGFQQLRKGYEKAREHDLWEVWLARLPKMTKKTFVSFEDFKKKGLRQATTATSTKSAADIIKDAKKIRERDRRHPG